ncbi:MAG: Zn-dependent exopeptidase M28 [Chloroflexi bacterium]|nr:Zn-dependent exopeptidase M28 [Chloroflexota bacterium]MBU1747019.1 Zn-dependent exopeptidase M28 [Chloroflexota bacterium]
MTVDLPTAVPTSRSLPTATPAPTLTPVPPSPTPTVEPRPLVERISEEALFETLRDLAEIRSYRGWRSAGSPGETEALDYLTRRLAEMPRLQDMGLTVAREAVPIYLANLVHDVRLVLHVGDRDVAVPAQAPWGHIDNAARAAQFDTDGRVGDVQPDPLTASGPARAILTVDDLAARGDVSGQVLLVNYVLVDQVICGSDTARERAMALRNARPAAIVLVTTYGEQAGQSTGLYALDRPALTQVDAARVPVVTVRLEDLAELGVASLADLAQVRSAQLTVDVDIVSPGASANLVARVPGQDEASGEARAIILGAHIDSANTPGALDDGSGAAVLLEVARTLNEGATPPPVTVYLLWFGSEELGLYGSLAWANAHPTITHSALAAITFDSLAHPPAGLTPTLKLSYWSDGLATRRSAVPAALADAAQDAGFDVHTLPSRSIISDYAALAAFGGPCLNVAFEPDTGDESALGVQYAGRLHCPYDDLDLARLEARGLTDMARLAALAVSDLPRDLPADDGQFPTPGRRAVFVGSHTEAAHMMPAGSPELGRLLAAHGYAIDTIPYGTPVTAEAVRGAALVVVMPTIDYGEAEGTVSWAPAEVAALEGYVRAGGRLVITNSARRLKYRNWRMEANEDTTAMNALAGMFGVRFGGAGIDASAAQVVSDDPLVADLDSLPLTAENAVPFTLDSGATVLARAGGSPVVALVKMGAGQVLVLGDMGLLGSRLDQAYHPFWERLAQWGVAAR